MLEANFAYKGRQNTILCQSKDNLKELFNKFKNKENIKHKIIFKYNKDIINNKYKIVEQLTDEKSFTILAYDDENELTKHNQQR